jgi:anti-sigma factor RsiW
MPEEGITEDQIVALATGELDAAQARLFEAALRRDPEAWAMLERLRRLVADLRGDDTRPAPAAAIRRALEAFRPQAAPGPGLVAAFLAGARRVTAALVFDSQARAALAGFRGPSAARHLAFRADAGRLDLQIAGAGGPEQARWRLRGQVELGGGVGAVALVEAASGVPLVTGRVDADGRFTLDAQSGTYDLMVEIDHGRGVFVAPNLCIR